MEVSRAGIGVSEDGWVPGEMYDVVKARSEAFEREVLDAAETEGIGR